MMKLKDAVGYARYSTDRQNARSIDDQKTLCEKIAKQHGYRIIKWYVDAAAHGAGTLNRSGWLELMRDASAKGRTFTAVIIESQSRMSRDLEHSARDFKRLSFRQIALIDLEGVIDTMRLGMSGIMNQEFRKHLGNMMRRAWDGRIRDGLMPGRPAYGHRKKSGTSFEREIDPERAKIVKRIFTEYVNLEPVRDIAARLNLEGVPSPSGGKWNHTVLVAGSGSGRGMISNPIYIGKLIWNSHRSVINPETEKRNKQKGKPEDLLTVDVPHLRIIDQDLWDRAQQLRANRSRQTSGRVYKKSVVNHLLAGRLACGVCGGQMKIVWSKTGEHARVGCVNARHKGVCANSKSYDLVEIEATVMNGIKHNLDVEALIEFTRGAHQEWSARQRAARVSCEEVERELNVANERVARLVDAMIDTPKELQGPMKDKYQSLELKRAGLAAKLETLKADAGTNVVNLHPTMIQRFRQNLEAMVEALTSSRMTDAELAPFRIAFGNVFDRVVVHQTGKRKPVEVTPYARISSVMGIDVIPRMRSLQKAVEDQGITNLVLATQSSLGHQKQNIVSLGRWRQAA